MRPLTRLAIGAVALATALPASGIALAEGTTEPTAPAAPPAPAATSVIELPLLGVPLTVSVTTDVGGGLLDVALAQPEGFVATQVRPGKVTFVNDTSGVKVRVSGAHGRQRVEARAGALADISGPGSWVGDVFETGENTTVVFEVTAGDDGGPDIGGVSVTGAPGDVEWTVGTTERGSETDDDDGEIEQWASTRIDFSYLGQTRSLRITARVETGGDDDPSAALKISLSKLQGRQIQTPDAAGVYRWTGALCDGTAASIEYTVVDGAVQVGATSPDADVRAEGRQAKVSFSRQERVSIKVMSEDGVVEVGASQRFRCDRVDPIVNTPIDPSAGRGDDDDHDDDHERDHRGDDDHDDDDERDHRDDEHDDDDDDHDRGDRDRGDRGDRDDRGDDDHDDD